MKPKSYENRLKLKKQTIVDLNGMKDVKAGINDQETKPSSIYAGTKIVCCGSGCPGDSLCVCK